MDDIRNELISIGQFAMAAQLSLKALRLYHQRALLVPAYMVHYSSYRYYTNEQLRLAKLIRLMRQMEMPLTTVGQVIAAYEKEPQEAEVSVYQYLKEFEKRVELVYKTSDELFN